MKHKLVLSGISLLVVVILVCLSGLRTIARETDPFTFPELDGWEIKQEYPVYNPGTLWDYINGAADSYMSYDFIELYIAEYIKGDVSFKVEVFKHATPLDAFGIYSTERSPGFRFIDLGIQGYREESLIHFLADRYYIKVRTHKTSEEVENAMMSISNSVVESIAGINHFPETLAMFPDKGKKPETEIYIAENFLGHNFLGSAFTTDYLRENKNFKLFIIVRENKEDCLKLLKQYFEFAGKTEKIPEEGEIHISDKYNGEILIYWYNNMVFGTLNLEDRKLQIQVIGEIKKLLK
ncbi:MAG: hypothetical protein IMY71_12145 [Bacteroidetes bacterium]|nr:hypothetical protein [Bacteroidota bacterium]